MQGSIQSRIKVCHPCTLPELSKEMMVETHELVCDSACRDGGKRRVGAADEADAMARAETAAGVCSASSFHRPSSVSARLFALLFPVSPLKVSREPNSPAKDAPEPNHLAKKSNEFCPPA